ncbi:hypothetical protein BZK20_07355 [Helicobacter pylori]|nr:hypothetical protein BZK20_07355 [Helicobacter pylori]
MFSPFQIGLDLVLGFHTFNRMYLEHYNIKAFFFFSFWKNVVIFLILNSFCFVWWCGGVVWRCGLREWLRRMDLNH